MIKGVGVDLIDIGRIANAIEKNHRFLERVFNDREREWYMEKGSRPETAAGIFAAKEAVSKVLGTGIGKISWQEIAIEPDDMGKPVVLLMGKANQMAQEKAISSIHVSISHERKLAIAFAVGQ